MFITTALLAATLCLLAVWYMELRLDDRVKPVTRRTVDLLHGAAIPSFPTSFQSMEEAVERINRAVDSVESTKRFRVVLWTKGTPPKGFKPWKNQRRLSPAPPTNRGADPSSVELIPDLAFADPFLIELPPELENPTLYEVLELVARMYSFTVGQRGDEIYLVSADGTFEEMQRRAIAASDPTLFGLSRSVTGPVDVRHFFEECGVHFPPGSSAVYHPRASRLLVVSTEEDIDLCDAVVNSVIYCRYRPPTWAEECREWIKYWHQQVADWFYGLTL